MGIVDDRIQRQGQQHPAEQGESRRADEEAEPGEMTVNSGTTEGSLLDYLLLCLTAFAAGAQNSLAGGGTLYTFPALMGVLHNSVWANATSTVALLPGSVAGAWGFRKEIARTPRSTL